MERDPDLLQGTLDLLILRVLKHEALHGWGIADRIQVHSGQVLSVGEGSLYPALYRLEARGWVVSSWSQSEKNRRPTFYKLTRAGRRQLDVQEETWQRVAAAIAGVLKHGRRLRSAMARLRYPLGRDRDAEMAEEMRAHLEHRDRG